MPPEDAREKTTRLCALLFVCSLPLVLLFSSKLWSPKSCDLKMDSTPTLFRFSTWVACNVSLSHARVFVQLEALVAQIDKRKADQEERVKREKEALEQKEQERKAMTTAIRRSVRVWALFSSTAIQTNGKPETRVFSQ